jgi:hypothetical protein
MTTRLFSAPALARLFAGTALLASTALFAQAQKAITLDHGGAPQSPNYQRAPSEASFANSPADFYAFSPAKVGEPAPLEAVTLRFSEPTTLTKIESASADFVVENGGSCAAGNSYGKGDSCIVLARFAPQGPGRRLGRLNVSHTASAEPASYGLGGYAYFPAISFVPAATYTIAATYSSPNGVLKSAQNLTVDGSDTLYIADSGNNVIRYMNASGTLASISSGVTDPFGIAADNYGNIYFSDNSQSEVGIVYDYATNADQLNGSGSGSGCTYTSPCEFYSEAVSEPGQMSMDRDNNLFMGQGDAEDVVESATQPYPPSFFLLSNPFVYQEDYPDAFAVDEDDNQYFFWHAPLEPQCMIMTQTPYDAENNINTETKVAGSRTCGYSGDGGQAGNAQIGTEIGQIAFDAAGNLYFTDTNNQRVRRINVDTGIITTVLGTGAKGFTDANGNRSTIVNLSNPTGLAVDSQGQIYVITEAPAGSATEVVQKVGANGFLSYGNQTEGTTSAAQIAAVTNVGNYTMTLTGYAFTGSNPGDFSIDPTTTSCLLTAGSTLTPGETCQIGVLFKPTATGSFSANLVLLDNTVNNSNTIELAGVGTSSEDSKASFVPGAVSFPATVPTQSSTTSVTITNTGNAALDFSKITLGGADASAFSFTGTCAGSSIAPKATCTLNVTFKPSSTGSYSAALKFTDNAPDSPQSVPISGSAVVIRPFEHTHDGPLPDSTLPGRP